MSNSKETVELKISDVVYRGKGLARLDGKVVFVPDVLPGEVVKAGHLHHSKNFSEARLVEVIEPSPARIKPVCPLVAKAGSIYNTTCQGCVYQHADYATEVELKQKQFVNLLERMGGVDASVCLAAVPSPVPTGYRNKITLHGAIQKKAPALGYYTADDATVIDVPACPLARSEINELLTRTRADHKFAATVNDHMTATFRFTETDGAIMWVGRAAEEASWLTESLELGNVKVPRGSFFQVNISVADLLISHVVGLIGQVNPRFVADMFCGVGIFAIAAAKTGVGNVLGADMDERAVMVATQNAIKHGIKEAEFKATTAQKGLKWALGKCEAGKTTVIIDPPRRGLEKGDVESIIRAQPAGIIYVSCAADTMARDVKQLKGAGYSVRSARLFDMFPRTPYFESVAWLVR